MRSTKFGSIGEIPPKTRARCGLTSATASAAAAAISENIRHSGSIPKSQWDLLFGSFQIITASIIVVPPNGCVDRAWAAGQRPIVADEHFGFRMIYKIKSGTAQHAFDRGTIWNPPISGITGVTLLNEI